jgi:hypothetical protein
MVLSQTKCLGLKDFQTIFSAGHDEKCVIKNVSFQVLVISLHVNDNVSFQVLMISLHVTENVSFQASDKDGVQRR